MKKALRVNVAEQRGDFHYDADSVSDEDILNDTDGFSYGNRWDEWPCFGAALMACRLVPRLATGHSPLYELTGKRPIRSRLDAEHRAGDDFYDPKFTGLTKATSAERIRAMKQLQATLKASYAQAQNSMKKKYDKRMDLKRIDNRAYKGHKRSRREMENKDRDD